MEAFSLGKLRTKQDCPESPLFFRILVNVRQEAEISDVTFKKSKLPLFIDYIILISRKTKKNTEND